MLRITRGGLVDFVVVPSDFKLLRFLGNEKPKNVGISIIEALYVGVWVGEKIVGCNVGNRVGGRDGVKVGDQIGAFDGACEGAGLFVGTVLGEIDDSSTVGASDVVIVMGSRQNKLSPLSKTSNVPGPKYISKLQGLHDVDPA